MDEELKELNEDLNEFLLDINDKREKALAQERANEILKNYQGDDAIVDFKQIYEQESHKPSRPFMSTGYAKLDEMLGGGIREGELILVTGYSGDGKTSFLFDMTRNMEDKNVLWLPFEEPSEEFAEKLIYWNQQPPKFYTPNKIVHEDLAWIEDRILEATIKFGTKVVFLDNLHYITMSENVQEQWGRVGMVTKQLKEIARKAGVAIVCIVHLRKGTGINTIPTYEDIHGGGDSYKVAHKIFCVWREKKRDITTGKIDYTGNTIVAVQKVRGAGGKLDTVTFTFDKGRFFEQSAEQYYKEITVPKMNINWGID